jgi:hypothetical protein
MDWVPLASASSKTGGEKGSAPHAAGSETQGLRLDAVQ